MAPRKIFEQELEQLREKMSDMGEYAGIQFDRLCLAVRGNDRETLKLLLVNDRGIVDMQRSIEAGCLALMTKQQPVAGDLRLVSAALKAVTDLERIGDHVSDMAELFLRRTVPVGQAEGDEILLSMMEETRTMFREAMEAFSEEDAETARMVIDSDDAVDALFNRMKEKMMEAIRTRSLDADSVVDNLMLAKYLEKVGDHAVNIGEWALFRVTGEIGGREIY